MVLFQADAYYTFNITNNASDSIEYDVSQLKSLKGVGNIVNATGVLEPSSTVEITVYRSDAALLKSDSIQVLTLAHQYGRPVFLRFGELAGKQTIDLAELPGFDIIENSDTRDYFTELGYGIELTGNSISDIQLVISNV